MQETVTARLVRYRDGRPDVQVWLEGGWFLIHRLLEHRLRVVQFIPFPDATWEDTNEEHVLFSFPGCAIIESARLNGP